jgi:5-methylcytosine-specific restriction endonuclease McrA
LKDKSAFHKSSKSPDGLRWICKSCRKQQDQKYLTEEVKEKTRSRAKAWYQDNPDAVKERARRWEKDNLERVHLLKKVWRGLHPDKVLARNQRYAEQHPDKILEKVHRRRAKKHGAIGGHFTNNEWLDLLGKYGHKCLCCGRTDVPLERDHVIPLGPPHSDEITNIQPLCRSCNSRKGNKVIDYR